MMIATRLGSTLYFLAASLIGPCQRLTVLGSHEIVILSLSGLSGTREWLISVPIKIKTTTTARPVPNICQSRPLDGNWRRNRFPPNLRNFIIVLYSYSLLLT